MNHITGIIQGGWGSTNYQPQIDELKAEILLLQTQQEALQTQMNEQHSTVQAQIGDLQNQQSALQNQLNDQQQNFQTQITDLQTDVADLKQRTATISVDENGNTVIVGDVLVKGGTVTDGLPPPDPTGSIWIPEMPMDIAESMGYYATKANSVAVLPDPDFYSPRHAFDLDPRSTQVFKSGSAFMPDTGGVNTNCPSVQLTSGSVKGVLILLEQKNPPKQIIGYKISSCYGVNDLPAPSAWRLVGTNNIGLNGPWTEIHASYGGINTTNPVYESPVGALTKPYTFVQYGLLITGITPRNGYDSVGIHELSFKVAENRSFVTINNKDTANAGIGIQKNVLPAIPEETGIRQELQSVHPPTTKKPKKNKRQRR